MKERLFACMSGISLLAFTLVSCSEDPAAPTAEIFATIDEYTVTFNPTVTNANTFEWDFGDDSPVSTEESPVHIYESFGEYLVTLTVTGEGGSFTATKTITIEATSIRDLLTGGINATAGKTWILDRAYTVGDGGGPVQNPPYIIAIPSTENVLDVFGLGTEYDNEFTFFFDGSYAVNAKNGNVLAGAVYGYFTSTISGDPSWDIGLCAASYTSPASATWTLNTSDIVVDAIADPNDLTVPPVHGNVTITGQNWISFSEGAFFGILDFPATSIFIIDELTTSTMRVSMLVCAYGNDGGDPAYNMMPSNMYHLTYIKK